MLQCPKTNSCCPKPYCCVLKTHRDGVLTEEAGQTARAILDGEFLPIGNISAGVAAGVLFVGLCNTKTDTL